MTNYEWLVKENRLTEFIGGITGLTNEEFAETWKMSFDRIEMNSTAEIVNWLQSEHKATKWVRLDEVLKAFNRGNVRLILSDINKLETKEIEDEV